VAVESLLGVLVFAWFGVHIGFPRGSPPSRIGGAFLALTFLQLVVYWAITRGAQV
jgi:hypothetical protein